MPQNRVSTALPRFRERITNFAIETPINGERYDPRLAILGQMKKTPATLAKQIERGMDRAARDWARYAHEHCAVYEKDLEQIWPRNDKDRKKKLVEFAAQYGFRLRFYHKGLFAIFGKLTPLPLHHAGAGFRTLAC
jgi:hypothetical protein